MTVVSNDPSFWPLINLFRVTSYFAVASFIVVIYDWALTFDQELELVWRHRDRWSLMTILYLSVRYLGMIYSAIQLPQNLLSIPVTDLGCTIIGLTTWWMANVINIMLGVILITRLYAMYQRSRKVLVFLIAIFSAVMIVCIGMTAEGSKYAVSEELVLSGTYQCIISVNERYLAIVTWTLGTAWEVLALCFAAWIVVKHFRELPSQTIEDCFAVLIKTHVFYFMTFTIVSCFNLIFLSPMISNTTSVGNQVLDGIRGAATSVQMFVLGPRLILSVRQFHAALIEDSDAGTGMGTIIFQAGGHQTSSNDV